MARHTGLQNPELLQRERSRPETSKPSGAAINFGYGAGQTPDLAEIKKLLTYQRDFQLLELSEPDWCVYHAKVATRYMCGAGGNYNV